MKDYRELLKDAGEFHGEICGGIVMGTKMAEYAMNLLGMEPGVKNKDLIVYPEIDRCASDAISSVTKLTVGKKSLKPVGYGKFAASFIRISTGEGIRLIDSDANRKDKDSGKYDDETIEERIERIANTPAEDLYKVQKVKVKIDPNDLPGKPLEIEKCYECGEIVMDGKHVIKGGHPYCKSCAEGSYYQLID